jgi:uncharacterized protein (DUF58 family)
MDTGIKPASVPAADHLRTRQVAEHLADAFPPLLIAADRIANAVVHGMHGRRRAGPGEDFWQYRPYSPGDAAQRIDWRKSARSGRVLIRETEWEATNTLWLWASTAPGMTYRSKLAQSTKQDRAVLLTLATAILAVRAGERVAAIGSGYAPDHTSRAVSRIARHYLHPENPENADLPVEIDLPKFSSCLLIGDFLSPLDEIAERLSVLAANGSTGHVVQVLDPAEESFPFEGRTEFQEFAGSGKLTLGKAQTLRDNYRARLAEHREGLRQMLRRMGWSYMLHHTDQSAQNCLMSLYALIARDQRMHTTLGRA